MEIDEKINKTQRSSNSAIPEAGAIVGRLADFWDELSDRTGKGKGLFIEEIFGGMWRDNDTGDEQEEILDRWFDEQSEEMKPLALMQAAFTSCAYAVQAMKAETSGELLEAWRCTSKANYWLGITIGTWSLRKDQPESINDFAKRGAAARHTENRAMKKDVFAWLDANMANFKSMDSAAEAIAGVIVPTKFRTTRDWVGEWKKLRSTGTP